MRFHATLEELAEGSRRDKELQSDRWIFPVAEIIRSSYLDIVGPSIDKWESSDGVQEKVLNSPMQLCSYGDSQLLPEP